jgi:hypothetical protein
LTSRISSSAQLITLTTKKQSATTIRMVDLLLFWKNPRPQRSAVYLHLYRPV